MDVSWCPSNLECHTGNKTGAPVGIEPGLRALANHPGRGHSCGTRTQAREHSEALPALGSEKRAHGVLLKRRQIRLPRTTRDVTHKPLKQGKKSCAKARGRTGKENTVCQPDVRTFTSSPEGSSQGPPLFCWPPPLSPPACMTMNPEQPLVVSSPSEQEEDDRGKEEDKEVILAKTSYTSRIEESTGTRPATQWAFNTWALFLYITTDGCLDMTPLPCPSVEHHPPEPQVPAEKLGPIASDQASVSATLECQETLEAAEALMTLKNSSWTWRQTHS
ncbi:doublesex- and mab-3-related transcription factor C1-like [Cricetulus griseus]|uniref:Doublesex- and mab-3-related transcription factor C1-like n=1 Tax=Cricetulus griseus TaxID=10029 RepID=A0A9J7HHB7_CRIGR|nr:doublesex- and mab-3-related transcription factor C1-like [Cricetulus griseus]